MWPGAQWCQLKVEWVRKVYLVSCTVGNMGDSAGRHSEWVLWVCWCSQVTIVKCCCHEAFLNPLASFSPFQCVATYYIQCTDSPSSSSMFIPIFCHFLFFAAFAFTPALCSHVSLSFSLTAVVLAIIYDVYTTFHIAVYIPTLIKQLAPHNSVNNCVVEYIEAKIRCVMWPCDSIQGCPIWNAPDVMVMSRTTF